MWLLIVIAIVAIIILGAYLTNPFSKLSIIYRPFQTSRAKNELKLYYNSDKIKVSNSIFWKAIAYAQCGLYIVGTRYFGQPSSKARTVDGIIKDIHELRYDPDKLLLISGDHFNGLFVRNLGVFYYPMLDASIYSDADDWQNRQTVYLQTVGYALGVFAKSPTPTTTIVSTGRYRATCINLYAYPSDTVFGIFYALASLSGIEKARPYDYARNELKLETISAAKELRRRYLTTMKSLYKAYSEHVFDKNTMLYKKDTHVSGAKDITRRSCAFFDNVVYWKTTQLAMELGVIKRDKKYLDEIKSTILSTFWNDEGGYFYEDLSEEGLRQGYYSSDWLIVLHTGFIDPFDDEESDYFVSSYKYIRDRKIARPFAIKYQHETRASRQFLPVRLAVASYGGDAIWSFWGMEYIKMMVMLYKKTGEKHYAVEAKFQLDAYADNMLRDGGYPETYDAKGNLLKTAIYKSVLETGWVIGYEQARAMYRAVVGDTSQNSSLPVDVSA